MCPSSYRNSSNVLFPTPTESAVIPIEAAYSGVIINLPVDISCKNNGVDAVSPAYPEITPFSNIARVASLNVSLSHLSQTLACIFVALNASRYVL